MKKLSGSFIIQILAVILVVMMGAGGGYYAGYEKGQEKSKTVIIRGVNNLNKGKETGVDFSLFWEAWDLLKNRHVDGDKAENQELVYGAIEGLYASLDDPNTIFLSPEDAKKFGEDISGEFSGIGAEIGIQSGQLVIISPLKDSPAEKAGLEPSDQILKIDDTFTVGMTVDEAVKRIRGKKDTEVTLNILKKSWDSPRDIKITRDIIQVPTLDFKWLGDDGKESIDGGIAYIHLFNFFDKAPSAFYRNAIQIALNKDPNGIIFDLRNNPGGFLDAGINIAGWFLEFGDPVVSEEFRGGKKQTFNSRGNGLFKDVPVVVLINEGSASASEIVAGALRDNRGIKLVGKKSFGKGTVQEVESLRDESLAKITIAHWLTPKGHLIDKNGLAPDYEVEMTPDDIKEKKDPQLEKAVEILKSQFEL